MKSFLSLERPATFTCIKNGWKRKYIVYEGAEFVNYDMILEEETTEESGVECSLEIINYQEKVNFINKAKQKLAYYDTAVLVIDGVPVDNTISRNDIFQMSTINQYSELHLCLKDVVYKIDWDALGISRIDLSIALRFGLDSGLKPTPSRESYITNQQTKEVILAKITEFSNYLVNKYNENIPDEVNFKDGFNMIGNGTYSTMIDNRPITINNIVRYSSFPIKEAKITGLKLLSPNYLKSYFFHLNSFYTVLAQLDNYGTWKNKRIYRSVQDVYKGDTGLKIVMVDTLPIGRVKSFLIDKYGKNILFVKKNTVKLKDYINTFNLKRQNKSVWRATIQDWQHVIELYEKDNLVETNIENSKGFLDYLDKKTEERKEWRKNHPQAKSANSLNKQEGDITLALSTKGLGGKIVFKKKAYPINKLHKNKMYVVYGTEDDKEMLEELYSSCNQPIGYNLTTAIFKTCIIGKRELTKLPNIHNFISMEKFLSEGNKKFRQIATAQLIRETLETYSKFKKNLVLNKYLKSINDDVEVLANYLIIHPFKLEKGILTQAVMTLAKEQNLWDYSIYHVIKRIQDSNELLNFSKHLTVPDERATDDVKAEYSKIVNQFLLFNKVYKGKLENFELVETTPQPIEEKKSNSSDEEELSDEIDEQIYSLLEEKN